MALRKFIIRSPRYINGQYVFASPTHPVEVDLPEEAVLKKSERGLVTTEEHQKMEALLPHYVPPAGARAAAPRPEVQPTAPAPAAAPTEAKVTPKLVKRPSDKET